MECSKCHFTILPGDEYVKDFDKIICADCITDYIEENHDMLDIAKELGMSVMEAPETEAKTDDTPVPGQMDMFGGVYMDNESIKAKLTKIIEDVTGGHVENILQPYGAENLADSLISCGATFATDNNVGVKWISVKDKLPEHGRYLVAIQTNGSYRLKTATYNDLGWWIDVPIFDAEITHWMPIPEPPKEATT